MDRAAGRQRLAAVVLAAGEGKRFGSALPKVLHDLCGRPLLAGALDVVAALKPQVTVLVTGRGAEEVQEAVEALTRGPIIFARQEKLLGTAHAARIGDDALGTFDGDVLVVPADAPLLRAATLRSLVARHRRQKAAATVLTAEPDDPAGYGRLVRGEKGAALRIVEHRDATPAERRIAEVNSGVYVFDRASLRSALTTVDRRNRQGELYLTDVIAILREKGERIEAVKARDPGEIAGVNSRAQLAAAAAVLRARTAERLMDAGVTIVDPAQTYIDPSVKVGRDTVIHPMTFLSEGTIVGSGAEIGPGARIRGSRVGDGARVQFSVLDGARVGPDATVGPYAFLRPGSRLERGAKVGTFVEVKGSTVGEGSKVPHLSYVGDATIGRNVNVGAGTITVNYDPETGKKSKTVIGDGAKIGSDTMLVAPVRVARGGVTGAGSVVTRDVPANTVVVGAPAKKLRQRRKAEK